MVMVLEQKAVDEIARIGQLRYPNEACGLLIPAPHRGETVFELPNRSLEPADSFELWGSDILLQLEALEGDEIGDYNQDMLKEYVIWHTHPQSNVGPSVADMRNKPPVFKHLVVAISEDGPPVPTWF